MIRICKAQPEKEWMQTSSKRVKLLGTAGEMEVGGWRGGKRVCVCVSVSEVRRVLRGTMDQQLKAGEELQGKRALDWSGWRWPAPLWPLAQTGASQPEP